MLLWTGAAAFTAAFIWNAWPRRNAQGQAHCPACEDTIKLVQDLVCESCEVSVLDMKDLAVAKRAKKLGIRSVPAGSASR